MKIPTFTVFLPLINAMLIIIICILIVLILARNADEREQWVRALEETILRHSQPLQVSRARGLHFTARLPMSAKWFTLYTT